MKSDVGNIELEIPRDISNYIEEMYGIPLSAQSISKMTDKIIPVIE